MDDFKQTTLQQCTHELCARLTNVLTAPIIQGIRSIFEESWLLCQQTQEPGKYLMTFQNLLSRVPKWNENIIETEVKRIVEQSGCQYLEDLITCVHIIQLKTLTAVRVASKMKKIDIDIPKLEQFIHRVYIFTARKLYSNVYLFERHLEIGPNGDTLLVQKNSREVELIVTDCILNAVRESIPIEDILRAYMDESVHVEEEVIIGPPPTVETEPSYVSRSIFSDTDSPVEGLRNTQRLNIENIDDQPVKKTLTFNQVDSVVIDKDDLAMLEKPVNNLSILNSAMPSQSLEAAPIVEDALQRLHGFGTHFPNSTEAPKLSSLDGVIELDKSLKPFQLSTYPNSDSLLELDDIEIL